MSKETKNSGGIGIAGVLGIVFIVLKLCKLINWSWWWVLSPFWIPIAVFILCTVILKLIDDDK